MLKCLGVVAMIGLGVKNELAPMIRYCSFDQIDIVIEFINYVLDGRVLSGKIRCRYLYGLARLIDLHAARRHRRECGEYI